jgi:hypothetical protein
MNKLDLTLKNYYVDEINKLESGIIGMKHVIKYYKKELKKLGGKK